MRRRPEPKVASDPRRGTIAVNTAGGLITTLGMMLLLMDNGVNMTTLRTVQNASDAAALVAANSLAQGMTTTQASQAATSFITNYYGLTGATVTVIMPPGSGADSKIFTR